MLRRAIILFLVLFLFLSIKRNSIYNDNKIEWCHNYKLKWKDFKGIPDSTRTHVIVASTYGEIKVENGRKINGIPKFDIKCFL